MAIPKTARARELREMQELLRKKGYGIEHAKKLQTEGMGPFELEDRLRHKPGSLGSLEYTHQIVKEDSIFLKSLPKYEDFRVVYLGAHARRAYHGKPTGSLEVAKKALYKLKSLGRTVWIETESGSFVPVPGAKRKPMELK